MAKCKRCDGKGNYFNLGRCYACNNGVAHHKVSNTPSVEDHTWLAACKDRKAVRIAARDARIAARKAAR